MIFDKVSNLTKRESEYQIVDFELSGYKAEVLITDNGTERRYTVIAYS